MTFSSLTVSLKPEITLTPVEGNILLQSSSRKLTFHQPEPGLKTALDALKQGTHTPGQLQTLILETDGTQVREKFDAYLNRLIELGWICHAIPPSSPELSPLATAIPMVGDYYFDCPEIDWDAFAKRFQRNIAFTLSRFAYLHQVEGEMVLESPLTKGKIKFSDWRGPGLVSQLSQPQTATSLSQEIPGITEEIAQQFLSLLFAAQMLSASFASPVEEDEEVKSEEATPPLVFWEFHDLLFHSRSRLGRHNNPLGGIFPYVGKIDPLPGVKPLMSDVVIPLAKPNLEELNQTDMPLSQALETRRSIRRYDETPITLEQLGQFLYRCSRVKKLFDTERGEVSNRPYPGGGAIYELEIYPVVNACQGLEQGLYHYHPLDHVLCQVSAWTAETEALVQDVWFASAQHDQPQVVFVITARFGRMFWKYQSMAYAAILKHVGVMYQTFYLVATSMNLAPCGIGAGNSDLFQKATGIDYYEESSVGEFMLASVPVKP
ncbi:SagB family peptide dehydrogenase [Moorena bouillonii]|uniref:Dehydrogenase n=1 Tax=Moorena bouillonii PNG TaxID=568701 RepID=A0A1U7N391_9CYAN|nr:SagB family peptide dehydrogenase [Moorena bouillonii]OLT60422.1 dehydrogenase [Moorena bouillonii PNG]